MWQPITDPKQIQRAMAGYPCWLEMDLDNLRFNLANIRSRVGVEVMPVVKNNAYGHGLVPVTRCLYDEGIRWFLVAKLYEADVIRQQFPESKVLCMDTLFGDPAYDLVVSRGISQAVFTLDMAQRLNDTAQRHNTQASVFIKVDTGLRRVGVYTTKLHRTLSKLSANCPISSSRDCSPASCNIQTKTRTCCSDSTKLPQKWSDGV